MKFILSLLVRLTWFHNLGEKLKYRIKDKSYSFKKTGWSLQLYSFESNVLEKKWVKRNAFGWYTKFFQNKDNILGFADPFLITIKEDVYVYFEAEVKKEKAVKGEIWAAKIKNNKIQYSEKVFNEKYHMSFPYVFYYKNKLYMLPESSADNNVKLYKNSGNPYNWELIKILKTNCVFADTNFIEINGVFYWFTYDLKISKTRIFYSESLEGEWHEHQCSPTSLNRNAGAIIKDKNKILRPIQISKKNYGEGVELIEISTLNKEIVIETNKIPFLYKKERYNLNGTHHFTYLENEKWIITDGLNNNYYRVL